MTLTVGVPKEIKIQEYRVAITPDGVREVERHGVDVFVETTAGDGAGCVAADVPARAARTRIVRGQAAQTQDMRPGSAPHCQPTKGRHESMSDDRHDP